MEKVDQYTHFKRLSGAAEDAVWEKHEESLNFLLGLRSVIDDSIHALREAEELRLDRDYWKQQYDEMLNSSINHANAMNGMMLKAAVAGVFTPRPDSKTNL